MRKIEFSVQGELSDREAWLGLARSAEAKGCESLYVSDHPGTSAAPFVALAAAAVVTERLRLGTCVINAGLWEPMSLASEVATLDVISDGRARFGVGAGHTPSEWIRAGRPFPSAGERVSRMIELVDTVRSLLAGETVTHWGLVSLDGARLEQPRPLQQPIPLMVGGNGRRVLRFAAERADRVGVTGFGRTLADGHRHQVDWSPSGVAQTVETIRDAADSAGRSPEIEAFVQHVEVTDDAGRVAARLAEHVDGATPDDLLAAPFMLIGTERELVAEVKHHGEELGITHYVIRERAIEAVAPILEALSAGTNSR